MERNLCRLCGKVRNATNLLDLSVEIVFQVSYYCRVDLVDDKNLSQKICFDCNYAIVNFAKFSENVKDVQIQCLIGNDFINAPVKDEQEEIIDTVIEILPESADDKHKSRSSEPLPTTVYVEEQIIEQDNEEEEDFEQSCSDWDRSAEPSDSEFEAPLSKRRGTRQTKRSEEKPKKEKIQKIHPSEVITISDECILDVPASDKHVDGSLAETAYSKFPNLWCKIRLSCMECGEDTDGPHLLKNHYIRLHSDLQDDDEKYQCTECDGEESIVTYFYEYLNHAVAHQPHLKFCCIICSKMFCNTYALYHHYQKSHEQSERISIHSCLVCCQFFQDVDNLEAHEQEIHKIQVQREEIESKTQCQSIVETLFAKELASDFVEHQNTFEVSENEKNIDGTVTDSCIRKFAGQLWSDIAVPCAECAEILPSPFLLSEHYSVKHADAKTRNYICNSCPEIKTFFNFESFINHVFTIHYEHLRYICFVCDSMFWNYKSLYNHFGIFHYEVRVLMCIHCGKYHKSGYDLKCHKEIHGPKRETIEINSGPFECSQCQKAFSKAHQLRRHLEAHKNVKTWICETCGKSFSAKATLINHRLVHTNDRPWECGVCHEKFKSKYKLKHHQMIHTGEKPWACETCGQRFRAKGTLKAHALIHTGERPWSCEYCEKRFGAKYDLMVHTRLHTGEYTHECSVCGERYPSWSNYSKHMRGRHQIDPRSEKKKKYDALHKSEGKDQSNSMDSTTEEQTFYITK